MLIDRAVVEVRSGKGGDGAISFLQEKNMPKGGPDGGNGGHGGSVYFEADPTVNTLLAYRHSKLISALDGGKGDKKLRFGASAEDVTALVPVGTLVIDEGSGRVLADLNKPGDRFLAAKGGRGGRGNAAFKSSRLRIPRIAENGHPGERKRLVLELKLLADVGLLGLPNAGKSSFITAVSNARPKVADYPFTTLHPHLGVVRVGPEQSFVIADVPGLIEGAAEGAGLGHLFLRHLSRTKVLLHVIDAAPLDEEADPVAQAKALAEELEKYDPALAAKPRWIVLNKMDLVPEEEREALISHWREAFAKEGEPVFAISAAARQGVEALVKALAQKIDEDRRAEMAFLDDERFEGEDAPAYEPYDPTAH